MDKIGWRFLVLDAAMDAINNDNPEKLDLLAEYLAECDKAKQALRDKGYGWTGLGILETIQTQVPPA